MDEFNRRDEVAKPKRAKKKISKTTHLTSENKLLQDLRIKQELLHKSREIEQNYHLKASAMRGSSYEPQKKTLSSYVGKSFPVITDTAQEKPQQSPKKSYITIINQEDSKPRLNFKPIELSKQADDIQQEPNLFDKQQQLVKSEGKPKKILSVPSLMEINEGHQIGGGKPSLIKLNLKNGSTAASSITGSWTSRERLPSRGKLQISSLESSPKGKLPVESFTARHGSALLPMSNDYLLKIILNKNETRTPRNNNGSANQFLDHPTTPSAATGRGGYQV